MIIFGHSADAQYYNDPIANFEYTSGTLTIRTPTRSGGPGIAFIGAPGTPQGVVTYIPDAIPDGYRGGAGGTLGPNAQSQYISGGINGNTSTPWVFSLTTPATNIVPCFYQGTLITLASGQTKSVEDLAIGEIIHTHKGPLPLKWLARRKVTKPVRQQFPHQLPVEIEKRCNGCKYAEHRPHGFPRSHNPCRWSLDMRRLTRKRN